jgi:hypothetical protein
MCVPLLRRYRSSTANSTIVSIPYAPELIWSSTSSNDNVRCGYLYGPNITAIRRTGTESYGAQPLFVYLPKLTHLDYSITVAQSALKYTGSYSDGSKITVTSSYYKHEFFSRVTELDASIPTQNAINMFNEHIEHATNGSSLTQGISIINMPNLKFIDNASLFSGAEAQITIHFVIGYGFKSNLDISKMTYLPAIDVLDILNKLADVTNEDETYTLTIGDTLRGKMTDREIEIATNKGWVVE